MEKLSNKHLSYGESLHDQKEKGFIDYVVLGSNSYLIFDVRKLSFHVERIQNNTTIKSSAENIINHHLIAKERYEIQNNVGNILKFQSKQRDDIDRFLDLYLDMKNKTPFHGVQHFRENMHRVINDYRKFGRTDLSVFIDSQLLALLESYKVDKLFAHAIKNYLRKITDAGNVSIGELHEQVFSFIESYDVN